MLDLVYLSDEVKSEFHERHLKMRLTSPSVLSYYHFFDQNNSTKLWKMYLLCL